MVHDIAMCRMCCTPGAVLISLFLPLELPSKPTEFTITERGDQWVELVWVAPPTLTTRPVDEYVLKLSYEERGTINSTRVSWEGEGLGGASGDR